MRFVACTASGALAAISAASARVSSISVGSGHDAAHETQLQRTPALSACGP